MTRHPTIIAEINDFIMSILRYAISGVHQLLTKGSSLSSGWQPRLSSLSGARARTTSKTFDQFSDEAEHRYLANLAIGLTPLALIGSVACRPVGPAKRGFRSVGMGLSKATVVLVLGGHAIHRARQSAV